MESSSHCCGAVLRVAGIDQAGTFDVWEREQDFAAVTADGVDSLVAEDNEALDRLVRLRYDAPPGCTRVAAWSGSLPMLDDGHRRRRAAWSGHTSGWRVLPCPLLLDEHATLALLRSLTVDGPVLVERAGLDKLKQEGGDLTALGFASTSSCEGHYTKLWWSPRAVAMRTWREGAKAMKERLEPHFTIEALCKVGFTVNPTQWTHGHPYKGLLRGKEEHGWEGVRTDRYRRGRYLMTYTEYSVEEIVRLIAVQRKLCPKLMPWRDVTLYERPSSKSVYALARAVALCLPNLWAVEQDARRRAVVPKRAPKGRRIRYMRAEAEQAKITLRFCRWLRREARHFKLAIPKPPKLPPKPTVKSIRALVPAQVAAQKEAA